MQDKGIFIDEIAPLIANININKTKNKSFVNAGCGMLCAAVFVAFGWQDRQFMPKELAKKSPHHTRCGRCFDQMDKQLSDLRDTVSDLIHRHEYKSALFWAEKVVCISSGEVDDVLAQARCLFHLKEFHRAIHCIRSRDLHLVSLPCRHLLAKSHFLAKQFKEAADLIIALDEENEDKNVSSVSESLTAVEESKWKSSLMLLKAQIFEALDNRCMAAVCFKEALKQDIHNFEAFQSLTQHQMLSHDEEKELLQTIDPQDELTRSLYSSLLKKYSNPSDEMVVELSPELQQSTDLMTATAESSYYQCDYYKCLKLTTEVLNRDVYHAECLPIHISCLMELKKTNQLFDLAHKLVDLYPESAISWYAVGCYYLMINNTDAARRFLSKSTSLDQVFGPAWLLYGHSFAVESEHDQAMAAYFKASHLMKGCHLPLHYIGLEYGQTENTKLAEKFFHQALLIAPTDPFVLHELGVVSFQNQE